MTATTGSTAAVTATPLPSASASWTSRISKPRCPRARERVTSRQGLAGERRRELARLQFSARASQGARAGLFRSDFRAHDAGFFRDHLLEALQVRDERCLVQHADLADD